MEIADQQKSVNITQTTGQQSAMPEVIYVEYKTATICNLLFLILSLYRKPEARKICLMFNVF